MSETPRRRLLGPAMTRVLTAGVCGLLLGACAFLVFYAIALQQAISGRVDRIVETGQRADAVLEDVRSVVSQLRAIPFPYCTDTYITSMRVIQFSAAFVRDIGRLDGQDRMICSSTIGRIDPPFEESSPAFSLPSGFMIWPNTPLALSQGRLRAHVLRPVDTPFNVVLAPGVLLRDGLGLGGDYSIYLLDGEGTAHLMSGDPGIPLHPEPAGAGPLAYHFSLEDLAVLVQGCADRVGEVCVVLRVPLLVPFDRAAVAVQMLIGGMLAGCAGSLLIWRFLYKRGRFRRRFQRGFVYDRFLNLYQPIVSSQDGSVVGVEVLARWRDENGLVRSPDKFLPHVLRQNRTRSLLEFVVRRAAEDLSRIEAFRRLPLKVAFNLTPRDFDVAYLKAVFTEFRSNLPRARISLELTEDEMVSIERVTAGIAELRAAGFRVVIDDFGTGYSSLSYLSHLHVDELKIDRSFIRNVENGTVRSELVRRVIEMAGMLKIRCVVEGVETREQVEWLAAAGSDQMQGFFFSRPLDRSALERRLRDSPPPPVPRRPPVETPPTLAAAL